MSSNPIFVRGSDDQVINLDGKEFTLGELKSLVIDGATYRRELRRIFGGESE